MRRQGLAAWLLIGILIILAWNTYKHFDRLPQPFTWADIAQPSPVEAIPVEDRVEADWIVIGAREEVVKGTRYDASYQSISYPGGDVSPDRGACTDVVIRALRRADIDLQQLIHEDMTYNLPSTHRSGDLLGPTPI